MKARSIARTSLWLVTASFMLVTWTGTVLGQETGPKRVKKEPWRELPGAMGAGMARTTDAIDRAIGRLNVSRLDQRTHNFGDMGGADNWYANRYPGPDGQLDSFGWNQTMALAVGPGTWLSTPQVHESGDDYQPLSMVDWEAQDGARGSQFSDPPETWSGTPMFATSDLPGTWPAGGWPAPESETEIWWGTETWNKWERKADRELYCEFDDEGASRNPYSTVLDISVRKRLLGYASTDAAFFQFELTNNSSTAYTECFIGQFGDFGSPVYGSWVGYPVYDATRQMTYNVGDHYNSTDGTHDDGDGNGAAWFGYMILESPSGSFRTDDTDALFDTPENAMARLALTHWADATYGEDKELYGALTAKTEYLSSAQSISYWKTDASKANPVLLQTTTDWLSLYDVGDADHYIYRASDEFTFNPGESINYITAVVAANTEGDLLAVADKAIILYQAQLFTSGPPPAPVLSASGVQAGPHGAEYNTDIHLYRINYTGSGSVTLTWDGSDSELALDAISGNVEFEGYKIYRSADRGRTWGEPVTDSRGIRIGSIPVAQFDIENSIAGNHPVNGFYLGEDSGLVHSWTDTDILDGLEYWYTITSYDYALPEPAYESSKGSDPKSPNLVAVIAGTRPSGYVPGTITGGEGELTAVTKPAWDLSSSVSVGIVDNAAINGSTYRITTVDSAEYGGTVTSGLLGVTLTNLTSGSVLYTAMLPDDFDLGTDLLPLVEGIAVEVSTFWNATAADDRLTGHTAPAGLGFASGWDLVYANDFLGSAMDYDDFDDARAMFPIEVRFDSLAPSNGYVYNRGGYDYKAYHPNPLQVWDVTPGAPRQVNYAYTVQTIDLTNGNDLDLPYDTYGSSTEEPFRHYVYFLESDYSGATPDTFYTISGRLMWDLDAVFATWPNVTGAADSLKHLHGTTWTIDYLLPMAAGNVYEFSTTAPAFEDTLIDYDDIKVVPNPYYVTAEWDRNVNRRKIMFTNVPQNCTIDIYTLAGELVASLDHIGSALDDVGTRGYSSDRIGTVVWNMWTYEFTEAAYGLYIYVLRVGDSVKKVGKFAIIR